MSLSNQRKPGDELRNWREITAQADHQVCAVLKTYVADRLPTNPSFGDLFLRGRDYLYAYHVAAMTVLSRELTGNLRDWESKLLSLDFDGYLGVVSALHTAFEVSLFIEKRGSRNYEIWFNVVSTGICDVYGRPGEYMRDWVEKIDWLAEYPPRVLNKAQKETAALFGVSWDPFAYSSWMDDFVSIAELAHSLRDQPGWSAKVASELAAHHRSLMDESVRHLETLRRHGAVVTDEDQYLPIDCPECGKLLSVHEWAYRPWRDGGREMPCPNCGCFFREAPFGTIKCSSCGVHSGFIPFSMCRRTDDPQLQWVCADCATAEAIEKLAAMNRRTPGRG